MTEESVVGQNRSDLPAGISVVGTERVKYLTLNHKIVRSSHEPRTKAIPNEEV